MHTVKVVTPEAFSSIFQKDLLTRSIVKNGLGKLLV